MIPSFVLTALTACVLVAAAVGVLRVLRGPRHADRIVALDLFLACAVALCLVASLATARTVFLDVGVGLALVGFVSTVAWARLLERTAGPEDPT